MIALLSFLHTCFLRSYRYGPPTFTFLLGILFVYSVVPNPVMESYAFSVSFLFIISGALSYLLTDLETQNQEAVTALHIGSLWKLTLCKLVYSWIFTIPLAAFAVLYPAIFHKFDRSTALEELGLSFLYHVAASWLGVTLACWFSSKCIASRVVSFLTLSIVIVLTLCAQAVEVMLPDALKPSVLLLPPLYSTIMVMSNYDKASPVQKFIAAGAPIGYGIILASLFLLVIHKRKLDTPQI